MSSGHAAPKRVVYVDDDDDIREIASLALSLNSEISVETCSSGEAALALLPRAMPEFILLDVMMPGLDGPSTLARIRADPLLADIPVAFITAKAMPRELERYKEMGAVGVIPKPFDPMLLAGQVAELWRASAAARPAAPQPAGSDVIAHEAVAAADDVSPAPRAPRLERLLKRVRGIFTATPPPAA
jgi:two-component system, OmpR family, response regulator